MSSAWAGAVRSLVKFDLSGIPANTTIDSASLQTYYDTTHTTDAYDVPIEVREVTKDWNEDTVTWNDINTSMGAGAATVEMVDDTDTSKVAMTGAWPTSGSTLKGRGQPDLEPFGNSAAGADVRLCPPWDR